MKLSWSSTSEVELVRLSFTHICLLYNLHQNLILKINASVFDIVAHQVKCSNIKTLFSCPSWLQFYHSTVLTSVCQKFQQNSLNIKLRTSVLLSHNKPYLNKNTGTISAEIQNTNTKRFRSTPRFYLGEPKNLKGRSAIPSFLQWQSPFLS